jgi:TetR/AcrR family transcriptional repressor of nem operon
MLDMMTEQIPDVPRKTARKQAAAMLATMMGTLVLARVAGSGELSDDILAAGREAALGRLAGAGSKGGKVTAKKAGKGASARH